MPLRWELKFNMWFVFTLVTILFWSGSDLFSKMGSAPDDKNSHWKMVLAVGAVMGLHAIWQVTVGGVAYDPINLLKYLPVSAMYILSMIFGYAGLRYIELSVSSPICNSSGAITALLCFLFLGQRMTGLQLGAVLLISAGILALAVLGKTAGPTPSAFSPAKRRTKNTPAAFSPSFFPSFIA